MKPASHHTRKVLPALLCLLITGCAADRYRTDGLNLIRNGQAEEGLSLLAKAHQADLGNASVYKEFLVQRDSITNRIMQEGNRERSEMRWDAALQQYNRVLGLDPGHPTARQAIETVAQERRQIERLDEATGLLKKGDIEAANMLIGRVLIESPANARALKLRRQILDAAPPESFNGGSLNLKGRKPVTLQFRDANLRMVMEAISKTTNLNIIFDKDVKSDLKVTIFVRDTPVEEAIDLILMQTQTTKRIMSENSFLIYPDTAAKARDYAELKIRRFSLINADPKQVLNMVKTMTKTKDTFIDEKTNALIIRDTPQVIRMVEKLIESMDQPEPEVMLEVDVMEITRDRLQSLGVQLPTSFGVSTNAMKLTDFKTSKNANTNLTGLAVSVQAQKTDADINDLATPRIRVRNKEKAKFLVGDRLPQVSTAAVPSSNSSTPVYNTTVQYVEVGLKIEVEPTIYSDGEVAIKVNLEVSTNSGQNTDAAKNGTIAYTISTRSVSTVLRLKDGQTEIIGGLIQDQDRANATRIPGVGDVPILGRLFGIQTDAKNKTEIVMSITPRIVRNNRQVDSETLEMWSGTESNLRFGGKMTGAARTSIGSAPVAAPVASISAPVRPVANSVPPPRAAQVNPSVALAATTGIPKPVAPTPTVPVQPAGAASPPILPVVMSAPATAKVGDQISVLLSLPTMPTATDLELSMAFDSSRLRLIAVNDANSERNAASGTQFSGDTDGSGAVRISVVAGRGQNLSTNPGALAKVQFEVLTPEGATQITVVNTNMHLADGSEQALPLPAPVSIDVKAKP